jgi:AraC-like DNA-binding protein
VGNTLSRVGERRLEGLCEGPLEGGRSKASLIRIGLGSDGIERLEARFLGQAFSPHRHDTYAIGITLSGVQSFHYCGERRRCLPGEGHILHPDELHDGAAGAEGGFGYRIVYIDPALVQQALGGRPLPFVPAPIVPKGVVRNRIPSAVWRLDEPIDALARVDLAAAVADMLASLSGERAGNKASLRLASLFSVRDLIAADPAMPHPVERLEGLSGLDRWTLARQFRAAFGTSLRSFRTMRQLDRARRMIGAGAPLAEVALKAGFADQSHMSRLFKRTYGLTPARWAALVCNPLVPEPS